MQNLTLLLLITKDVNYIQVRSAPDTIQGKMIHSNTGRKCSSPNLKNIIRIRSDSDRIQMKDNIQSDFYFNLIILLDN